MKEWKALWISDPWFAGKEKQEMDHRELEQAAEPEHPVDCLNHHLLARRSLVLDKVPGDCRICISADDYYKLYVNGSYVGEGPAQSHPSHYYYNVYDAVPLLREGINTIAVHVYYHGGVTRAYNSADYRQGFVLELEGEGGVLLGTDETWKVKRAEEYVAKETIGYHTQYFEHIDQRKKEEGWQSPAYEDSEWLQASTASCVGYRWAEQPTPPVQVYKVSPAHIEQREFGYFLDFGQELSGAIAIQAKGQSGEQVEIRCGEELAEDGSVRYEMRCNCTYRDLWILSGGDDTLEWWDYKAFRYVEIHARPETLAGEHIQAIVRHYPVPQQSAALQTDHELLDAIWTICRNGVVYGTQDYYTDCPTREKGGYLGDNTVTGPSHFYVTGDLRLYRKTLKDFALTSRICPGLMAVTPGNYMQEIADYSLQWPLQVLQYYQHSGDEAFVAEMLPYAEGLVDYFMRYANRDGLLCDVTEKWNLVDWPLGMRDGYDFTLTRPVASGCHNVINAFYYNTLVSVNSMREIAGRSERYAMEAFADAYRTAFWQAREGLYADAVGSEHVSLHGNMLPLLFGLVPAEDRHRVAKFLVDKRVNCGVYMAYFYLKALAAAGEHEAVWRMIISEEPHVFTESDHNQNTGTFVTNGYWANMVREGATTCFESWSKHLKWNTSLCHPWASSPIPVLIEDVLGIRPAVPGWKGISAQPNLPEDFPDLDLTIPVPSGMLRASVRNGQLIVSQ
jgi:alpha-L-rhamnosidase